MFKPIRLFILLAVASFSVNALAQPASYNDDPPTRVARLSYIDGAVSFVPAGDNDWVEADLNRPLISGDRLWTDRESRAVLELGDASVRIDQRTSFDFLNLNDQTAQIELTQGTMNLRVRRLYDGQSYEIDTPTLAFVVNRAGEYRVDVAPDGDSTIVSVRSGGGDVYGEDAARFRVDEGESVIFYNSRLTDYQVNGLPSPDHFDDFCYQRDRRWDESRSQQYVSEDVIGYQDLDQYGDWQSVPEYGYVWYPTQVAAGWAPYRHGHWVWVGLYGWTWVDDSPWGFAPFHYGRWAFIRGRWGWCPGPRSIRPVYAPALVAFVGGVNISISGGPIGWFPLGFGDVYYPPYRVNRAYFTRLNDFGPRFHRDTLDNDYRRYSRGDVNYADIRYANRHIGNAVTAVPARAFIDARPVAKSAIRVNETTFANAQVHGFARLTPTRESLARAQASRARPSAAVLKRPIVAATRPPAPIATFSANRASLQKNPGRPLDIRQLRNESSNADAARNGARPGINRPNIRIVTKQGTPTQGSAPALPKQASDVARQRLAQPPGSRGNGPRERKQTGPAPGVRPVERNNAPNENPNALESSRFAHPTQNPRALEHGPARPNPQSQGQEHRAMPPQGNATPRIERIERNPAPRPQPQRSEPQNRENQGRPVERIQRGPAEQRRVEPQVQPRPAPPADRFERRAPEHPQNQRPEQQRFEPHPPRAPNPQQQERERRGPPAEHKKKSDDKNDGNGNGHRQH